MTARITFTRPVASAVSQLADVASAESLILATIDSAERWLIIGQMYICCRKGKSVEYVLQAIARAARRGVKCKIFVDETVFDRNLRQAKIDYIEPVERLAALPNCDLVTIEVAEGIGIHHSKLILADTGQMWLGSNNLDWKSFEHIVEVGVHVVDKRWARHIEEMYRWVEQGRIAPRTDVVRGECGLLFDTYTKGASLRDRAVWHALLEDIVQARQRVAISTRRLSRMSRYGETGDWHDLVSALGQATERGVHVRILVDEYQFRRDEDRALWEELRLKNIDLGVLSVGPFRWLPIEYARMLHSKFTLIDDAIAWVGTGNLTPDDFNYYDNIFCRLNSGPAIDQLNRIFQMLEVATDGMVTGNDEKLNG